MKTRTYFHFDPDYMRLWLTPYRIDENDQKNFDRIMKLHPHFPELILAFKEHPDAYNNFVAMVSFQNL